jgi:hypothetical protein
MGYFLGSPGTREPDRKNWGSSVPKNQERTGTIFFGSGSFGFLVPDSQVL